MFALERTLMKECVSQPNWLLMVFFHYQICAYNSCYMNWFPGFSPSAVHQPTHTPAARHYRPTRFCYLGPKGISMMSHGLVRRSFLALAEGFLISEVVRNFPGADAVALYTPQKLTTWNPSIAIFHMHNWFVKVAK